MTTTTADEGFHEIQLNGKQLVFLFMAMIVVSSVIFLCGVLVGRGVRAERGPVDPLPTEVRITAPEPPPAAAAVSTGAPATASETLSYSDRLTKPEAPREQLKTAETAPPPAPAPPPVEVGPATKTPAAPVAAAPATAPAAVPAPAVAAAEPAGPGYSIQLSALGKREEADNFARRLTSKGYKAYVLAPEAGAPAVYRVRVGKFKDRREAESVKARLEKEEQLNPWIVR